MEVIGLGSAWQNEQQQHNCKYHSLFYAVRLAHTTKVTEKGMAEAIARKLKTGFQKVKSRFRKVDRSKKK